MRLPSRVKLITVLLVVVQITTAQEAHMNEELCKQLGAPSALTGAVVGCTWNENVLLTGPEEHQCEPSQAWMMHSQSESLISELSSTCGTSVDNCRYDANTQCLITAHAENQTDLCYTPPIEVLKGLLGRLVLTTPDVLEVVETQSLECTMVNNNATCLGKGNCVWEPVDDAQVYRQYFQPEESNPEIQLIEFMFPRVQPREDIQRIAVQAGAFERGVVTVTTISEATRGNVQSGVFQLGVVKRDPDSGDQVVESTGDLQYDATAEQVAVALAPMVGDVQVNRTGPHHFNRYVWVVDLSNHTVANETVLEDGFPVIKIARTDFSYENGQSSRLETMVITRHHRTEQLLSVFANATDTISAGSFKLQFVKPSETGLEFQNFAMTNQLFVRNLTAELLERELYDMEVDLAPALEFVYVREMDGTSGAGSSAFPGMPPKTSFVVQFTSGVQEYELGEYELVPLWFGQGCDDCEPFQVRESVAPTGAPTTPPVVATTEVPTAAELTATFEPTAGDSIGHNETAHMVDITVETLVSAPKVHGSFVMEHCEFSNYIPGVFLAEVGSNVVHSTCLLDHDVMVGEQVKIAGQVFRVEEMSVSDTSFVDGRGVLTSDGWLVDDGFGNMTAATPKCAPLNYTHGTRLVLDYAFDSFRERGVSVEMQDGLVCAWVSSLPISHAMIAEGGVILSSMKSRMESLTGLEVDVTRPSTPSKLGEFDWTITFRENSVVKSVEQLPTMRWKALEGTTALRGVGASVTVDKLQDGIAEPSGTFRLAFAGYDGNDTNYVYMRDEHEDKPRELDLKGSDYETRDFVSGEVRKISYTGWVSVNAGESVLEDSIVSLSNLIRGGVTIERNQVSVTAAQEPGSIWYNASASEQIWDGYNWVVRFNMDSDDLLQLPDFENLDADVPTIALFSGALRVRGNGAQFFTSTIQHGTGKLFQTEEGQQVEFSVDARDTPCVANATMREGQLQALGLSAKRIEALQQLDENMLVCSKGHTDLGGAQWPSKEDCYAAVDKSNGDSLPLCIWRGDMSSFNESHYARPRNVDAKEVLGRAFENNIYNGYHARVRYSNCTIPWTYYGQQVAKVFAHPTAAESENGAPAGNHTNDYERNQVVSRELLQLLNQFQRCTDDILELEVPNSIFVEVWQLVVLFTGYTVGFAYLLAGGWLAYRMNKIKLSMQDLGMTVLIVVGSTGLGVVTGMAVALIPAAFLSQVYASIPHYLSEEACYSLGISIGLTFLYFDCGRGSTL